MDIISVCVICVVTSLICKLLESDSGSISHALSLCAVAVTASALIYGINEILTLARRLYSYADLDLYYFDVLVKGAGICILTKTAADCCRDCNESALASAAETAGRVALVVIAFPLFSGVMSIVEELIV